MKAKLTKLLSTHSNLRSDVIEGWFDRHPEKFEKFVFYGEPVAEGTTRIIQTTPVEVVNFTDNNVIVFETKNSTYKLEIDEDQIL